MLRRFTDPSLIIRGSIHKINGEWSMVWFPDLIKISQFLNVNEEKIPMKLTQIDAEGFCGHDKVHVDLPCKLSILVGPNEAGKSSTLDTIRFALVGRCQRARQKNESGKLIKPGHKRATVSLSFNKDTASLQRATAPKTQTVTVAADGEVITDPDAWILKLLGGGAKSTIPLEIALGIKDFEILTERDSQLLIAESTTAGATNAPPLSDKEICDLMGVPALSESAMCQDVAALLRDRKFREAAKLAVDARAHCKATVKQAQVDATTLSNANATVVLKKNAEAQLARETPPAQVTSLADTWQKHADEARITVSKFDAKGREELEADLKALDPLPDIAALEKALAAAQKAENGTETKAFEETYVLAQIEQITKFEAKGKCVMSPLLLCALTEAQVGAVQTGLQTELTTMRQAALEGKRKIEAARDARKGAEDRVRQAREKITQADALKKALSGIAALPEGTKESWQKKADDATKYAQHYRDMKATIDRAIDAQRLVTASQGSIEKHTKAVDVWDGIAKNLEDQSRWPAAPSLAGEERPGLMETLNECLTTQGWSVHEAKVGADGISLSVLGRDNQNVAKSQFYRVKAAFQVAVARTFGIPFVILDEAEVLDGPHKAQFVKWLLGQVKFVPNILMALAQGDKEPGPSTHPDMAIYKVMPGLAVLTPLSA